MRIETEHFILKDFTLADMPSYCDMKESNYYRRKYDNDDYSLEKAMLLSDSYNASFEKPQKTFVLSLINAETQRFIGVCSLKIEDNNEAVLEHILRTETKVADLAAKAFAELTNYAFKALDVTCVYSKVIEGNSLSQRICVDSGMRLSLKMLQGTFFKQKWWNTLVYQKYKMAA